MDSQELEHVQAALRPIVREEVHAENDALRTDLGGRFDRMTESIDAYLRRSEAWHTEQAVLRARLDRITQLLVDKGIARQDELHV